jgi:hypothetical protein
MENVTADKAPAKRALAMLDNSPSPADAAAPKGTAAPKAIGPEPSPAQAAIPTRTIDHDAPAAE